MLDLAFQPKRDGGAPIYRQLADYLRRLVLAGRLPAGEKLPATRELAASLGLSRNTVNQAYQALIDDGVLAAHVGQGTFVASKGRLRPAGPGSAVAPRAFVWDDLLSRAGRVEAPDQLRPPSGRPVRYDFRSGRVDPDALPTADLKRAYARVIQQELPELADVGTDPQGWWPLRLQIARLLASRGIECEADDVVVTNGAQQAIDLVARVLVDPGDAVAMERPGYIGARMAFETAGAQIVGIDVDEQGLRTDQLARALRTRRIKLVSTTPAAQLPTGACMSEARRSALLELADETQTPVLEDDYDSEFRYTNPPIPALKTRDVAGQVIYVGTFSKAILPGLRLGYLVAAKPLLSRITLTRFTSTFGCDSIAQAAMAELLESGAFERHVRRLRRRYAERRQALLDAIADHMPDDVRWTDPAGGLGVWLTVPERIDPQALYLETRRAGISYTPAQLCFGREGGGERHMMLGFAATPPERIAEGIARLAEIVAPRARTRRSA